MIKRFLLLLISTPALCLVSCDKQTSPQEPGTDDTPAKEQAQEELADPSEVDEALRPLKLTKKQNEKIKAWMAEQGDVVDPAKMASFVRSILKEDQVDAFNKIMQLPDDLEPGDDGDKKDEPE